MPTANLKKVTLPPPPPQRRKMSNFQISRPPPKKKGYADTFLEIWKLEIFLRWGGGGEGGG